MKGAKLLLFGMPNRYGNLTRTVRRERSRRILEIGVWEGTTARAMIEAALSLHDPPEISYTGIDLFEEADGDVIEKEVGKWPPAMKEVKRRLSALESLGVSVALFRGPSRLVLPRIAKNISPPDLIFIDGGHSFETVSEDWKHVQNLMGPGTVAIFDDYVNHVGELNEGYGVNRVVDAIDRSTFSVRHLRPVDSFEKSWGILKTRMVRVQLIPWAQPV